jgi:hypothetical protein
MRFATLAVVLTLLARTAAAAQAPVAEGTRVRLQVRTGSLHVGVVDRLSGDTVYLRGDRTGGVQPYPASTLRRVEVSLGRRNRGRAAAVGGLIGLAVGGAMAAAFGHGCGVQASNTSGSGPYRCGGSRQTVSLVAGMGALGAVVGAAVPPRERWRTVLSPQLGIAATVDRHGTLGFSVRS